MRKLVVSESVLRQLLKEALGAGSSNSHLTGTMPVRVNPVVDPSAGETDPTNQNFAPKNKQELISALRSLLDADDATEFPDIYITIKDAVEAHGAEMNKQKVEETIRAAVRKILKEADLPPVKKIPYGVHGGEYTQRFQKAKAGLAKSFRGTSFDDAPEEKEDERTRKNKMMTDVGGASFKQIAQAFGFAAESGAKGAVEKALQKSKFVADMAIFDPDKLEILVLQAMGDYIDVLDSSGELSSDEVSLLKNNPAIVRELDGFRDFLDKEIRRHRKEVEKQDVSESISRLRNVVSNCFDRKK